MRPPRPLKPRPRPGNVSQNGAAKVESASNPPRMPQPNRPRPRTARPLAQNGAQKPIMMQPKPKPKPVVANQNLQGNGVRPVARPTGPPRPVTSQPQPRLRKPAPRPAQAQPRAFQPPRPGQGPTPSQANRPGTANPISSSFQPPQNAAPGQQKMFTGAKPPTRQMAKPPMGKMRRPSTATGRPAPGAPRQQPQAQLPEFNYDSLKKNCPQELKSMTMSHFPASPQLMDQSALTIGCIIQPMSDKYTDIPVINFADVGGVVRCRRCRAYINPFVYWPVNDNGRTWQCNLCQSVNETPTAYYCALDPNTGERSDIADRPELQKGCMEIVASPEYMVRPPMPPVYVFAFDMSSSLMLKHAVSAIKELVTDEVSLKSPRTQVGFIGFNATEVQFFSLSKESETPHMLAVDVNVLADYQEEKSNSKKKETGLDGGMFLPVPEDLLVNLEDCAEPILTLLESLEEQATAQAGVEKPRGGHMNDRVCLGEALMAAYSITAHIGGKLNVFVGGFCAQGIGKLTPRYNPNVLGTPSEHTFLKSANKFYTDKSGDFSRQQISVDFHFMPPAGVYVDMASISVLAKYTGGHCHLYKRSNVETTLAATVRRSLLRETAWEAVMRVRGSTNVSIKALYGHFLLRGQDLMALPTTNADSSFGVEFGYVAGKQGENFAPTMLTSPVSVQTALLYTNSEGERRIRVLTSIIPISTSMEQLYNTITENDVTSMVNLFAKKGVEIVLKSGFDDLRRKLQLKLVDLARAYKPCSKLGANNKTLPPGSNSGPKVELLLPEYMKVLPEMFMAMIKSSAFRGGREIDLDERSATLDFISRMSNDDCRRMFAPTMFGCMTTQPNLALQRVKPSETYLRSDCVFLFNNGIENVIWVGKAAKEDPKFEQVRVLVQKKITDLATEREDTGDVTSMVIVHEGTKDELRLFRPKLYMDRQNFNVGNVTYDEFLQALVQQSQSAHFRR